VKVDSFRLEVVFADDVQHPEDDDCRGIELGILEQIFEESRHRAKSSIKVCRLLRPIGIRKSLDSLQMLVNANGRRSTGNEARVTRDAV
jgi:hypothetical protein